jgi:hypothetical protein
MKLFCILFLAVSAFVVSCERHEFDGPHGTKQLNQAHGAGASHEAHGVDDAHTKDAAHSDHSKPKEHSEVKPSH